MAVSSKSFALPERVSFARIPDIWPMPGLIQIQLESFEWFKQEGLRELVQEISPIEDFTGKNLSLEFIVPPEPFSKPKYSEDECRDRDATYAAPLNVKARLVNKETGEIIEKDIFMGDFPLMTKEGTFIINGAERVVVSQLVRSPGVYFTSDKDANVRYIQATLDRDPVKKEDEALLELYKKLRPGDPATIDNARSLVKNLFFNGRRYDLGSVGRYKLNRKLDLSTPQSQRTLTQ